jgi:hypothetical protein
MLDLNNFIPPGSGWVLTSATAMNDGGRIVGAGQHNGPVRTFLLLPDNHLSIANVRQAFRFKMSFPWTAG